MECYQCGTTTFAQVKSEQKHPHILSTVFLCVLKHVWKNILHHRLKTSSVQQSHTCSLSCWFVEIFNVPIEIKVVLISVFLFGWTFLISYFPPSIVCGPRMHRGFYLCLAVLHRPWASSCSQLPAFQGGYVAKPPAALNHRQVVSEPLPGKMHFPQVIHYAPR